MNKPQHGGFVTGIVVGLLLGLGVALAVALYVTKTPVPFIDKLPQRTAEHDAAEAERNKNWDPNAPLAGKNPARPSAPPLAAANGPATAASTAAPAVAAAPAPASAARAAATAPVAAASRPGRDPAAILAGQSASGTAAVRPVAKPASAAVAAFFVQAGAYGRTDEAEAQRAKLALLGLDARITEREQSGRTVYRVRLGPFDAREPAEDAQGLLAGAGIDANLVRVDR